MCSNFFQPCILERTRITSSNRPSLLDNTFINTHDKEVYSGNIIDKISDHIPNFASINIFHNKTGFDLSFWNAAVKIYPFAALCWTIKMKTYTVAQQTFPVHRPMYLLKKIVVWNHCSTTGIYWFDSAMLPVE